MVFKIKKTKRLKILILGSNGQLGKTFNEYKKIRKNIFFIFLSQNKLNYTITKKIEAFLKNKNFDYIINCCAYTNVEDSENKLKIVKLLNFYLIKNLLKIIEKSKTILIHFSTDHVYDGNKKGQYLEHDKCRPLNYYGKTKLMADNLIMNSKSQAIIFRISWLYSKWNNNFVKKILEKSKKEKTLSVVGDQFGSPTYSNDLVYSVIKIIDKGYFKKIKKPLIFNFRNKGITSWYNFSKKILSYNNNSSCQIKLNSYKDYKTNVQRPANSKLSILKFQRYFKISIPHWKNSLERFFK
jgi:dTDP-4-dehydrorhamnose reductase